MGMQGRVRWSTAGVAALVRRGRSSGATRPLTHVAINTMNTGLGPVDGHLDVLAEVAAALDLRG